MQSADSVAALKSRIAALRLELDCRKRQLQQENLLKPEEDDFPAFFLWMERVMMNILHIESKKSELVSCEERLQNLRRAKRAAQKRRYLKRCTLRTLEEASEQLMLWVETRGERV